VGYVKADTRSGVLIYRRRFPLELVPFIPLADGAGLGRKELRVSLQGRTMDDPGVSVRWQNAKAEFDEIVQLARAAEEVARKKGEGQFDAVTPPLIAYLAEAFRQETLENDDTARWSADERTLFKGVAEQLQAAGVAASSPWIGREGSRWALKARETISASLAGYQAIRGSGDQDALIAEWQEEALGYAEDSGHVFDPSAQADMIALCRAFNDAAISAAQDRLKRLDGAEYPPTPAEPLAPAKGGQKGAQVAAVPLLELFDAYAAAQGISPGVRTEWRNYIDILIQFLGHDDAARLTWDDVSGWRDHLLHEPGRLGRKRKPVTVRDKYLTALKCTLNWAVEERRLTKNVAAEVTVRTPKTVKLRDPNYTMDEARMVLRASLVPPGPHLPAATARARRWLPWLCAYSGARVGELAQLRKEDVRVQDGVWLLHVTPEAGRVKTKEARVIPIHGHIIEQGFLAEVESQPPGPLFYNPDNRRAPDDAEDNRHVKKVGERLAKWVRETVGITDHGIKPNHAWRHLFSTLAEEAGISERTYNAIQGHAPANVGRKYGSTTVKARAEAMALFPRFDLAV
jgi:integrase